jgi:hypothetical protein
MTEAESACSKLRKYYDKMGIGTSPNSPLFHCDYMEGCNGLAAPRGLTRGAEAYVGELYGEPIKLVVVSLDTGGYGEGALGDCLIRRRNAVMERHANPHMKGTIKVLAALYGHEGETDLLKRFAMINCAKCAGRDLDKSMIPGELYANCREYGMEELRLLTPDLIITQGKKARELLKMEEFVTGDIDKYIPRLKWDGTSVRSWIATQASEYLRFTRIGDSAVIVMQTPHPSARQGQWPLFERTMLPTLAHLIRQMLPAMKGSV